MATEITNVYLFHYFTIEKEGRGISFLDIKMKYNVETTFGITLFVSLFKKIIKNAGTHQLLNSIARYLNINLNS